MKALSLGFILQRLCCCLGVDSATPPHLYSSPNDPVPDDILPLSLYGPLSFYGDGSVFPEQLLQPNNPFGTRPLVGDVSRLRRSIEEAQNFETTGKVFIVVVVGGSPAQGAACAGSLKWLETDASTLKAHNSAKLQAQAGPVPGIVEEGNFAFWSSKDGEEGDPMRCSWSGRLVRYLGTQLFAKHRNFVVINGAEGGVGSLYTMVNAHRNFEERLTNLPLDNSSKWASMEKPLGMTADLVLMDFTANDIQKTESEYLSSTESLFRYFLSLHHREEGREPTVALVDQPCPEATYDKEGKGVAHFHAVRRALALRYSAPVIDSVFDQFPKNTARGSVVASAAVTPEEKAQRAAFLQSLSLAAELRKLLSEPNRGAKGFGHNNAAYHEWVAASVFYSLLAPLGSDGISGGGSGGGEGKGEGEVSSRDAPQKPLVPLKPVTYDCSSVEDGGRGVTLCHLENSTATMFNFIEAPTPSESALRHDKSGSWVWGADVAGKNGWVCAFVFYSRT
jgi:hypothetical protein